MYSKATVLLNKKIENRKCLVSNYKISFIASHCKDSSRTSDVRLEWVF